jgi:hypothetical protein
MIIMDEERNAEFPGTAHERLSVGTQHVSSVFRPMPVNGCWRISASSDGVKILLRLSLLGDIWHFGLQWRMGCRKLEMQGGVLGKHAPANANTLIK